jgi:hypothetical protein
MRRALGGTNHSFVSSAGCTGGKREMPRLPCQVLEGLNQGLLMADVDTEYETRGARGRREIAKHFG